MKRSWGTSFLPIAALLIPLFASAASICPAPIRTLGYGSRGADVVQLQQFLITQNLLSADSGTGYFGKLTQAAVQQWQKKQGIVSGGTPSSTGYGLVGRLTRIAIATSCAKLSTYSNTTTRTSFQPQVSGSSYPPSATSGIPSTTLISGVPSNPSLVPAPGPILSPSPVSPSLCNIDSSSPPQTQTITCPSGQSGGITQTRAILCAAGTTSPTWSAWATTTNTCTTTSSWDGTIDMWQVFTAFARRHPHDVKYSTYNFNYDSATSGVDPNPKAMGVHLERMSGEKLIDRFSVVNDRWVDDVKELSGNDIGYVGTFNYTPWAHHIYWAPDYKETNRYIHTSDAGKWFSTVVETDTQQQDETAHVFESQGASVTEGIESFGVKDFGGNVGSRWYVRTSQRPIPANGIYTDSGTNEISYYDLGPAAGVYDPEFGHLEYMQQDITGRPSGTYSDQVWSEVEPGDISVSFYNYYSYGPTQVAGTFDSFRLNAGESKTFGDLQLLMQNEGNLVLYRGSTVLWAVGGINGGGTNCQGMCFAYFQPNGNLVLYKSDGTPYWYNNGNTVTGNQLKISDSYPYISIVNTNGTVMWQGNTYLTGSEYQLFCVQKRAQNISWCPRFEPK